MLVQNLFPSLWTSELCIGEQARGRVVGLLEEIIFYSNSNDQKCPQPLSGVEPNPNKWLRVSLLTPVLV